MSKTRIIKLPKASVVIPNYNGASLLRKNLPLIVEAQKQSVNRITEIIVVDDASTDESIEAISEFPQVRLVKHKKNRGVSASMNTGARSAKGNIVVLLNTDVTVTKNFLKYVYKHFLDSAVFGVSLHEKGYGGARGSFANGFVEHESALEGNNSYETFWVNGGSGVYRRDYWMKLKGMDEELFSPFYWEDIDLSYRAQKKGYKTIWEPKAIVRHEHESTIGKLNKRKRYNIQQRNQLLFIWKNITSENLFRKHIAGLFGRIAKHPGYIKIVLMALSKLGKVRSLRNNEKKQTKVSDEVIFAKFNE